MSITPCLVLLCERVLLCVGTHLPTLAKWPFFCTFWHLLSFARLTSSCQVVIVVPLSQQLELFLVFYIAGLAFAVCHSGVLFAVNQYMFAV